MKTICALIISVLIICSPAGAARAPYPDSDPTPKGRKIIESTWPSHLVKAALNVAWCESRMRGDAVSPTGTYKGLFQMGPKEFAANRHPDHPDIFDRKANSIAAYNLYLDRGWQPWSCRPCWSCKP